MKAEFQAVSRGFFRSSGNRRDGATLAVVLIMVVLLGILGVAILRNGEYVGVEATRGNNDARAFWVAEAGVNHAKSLLQNNASYRTSPWRLIDGYDVSVIPLGSHLFQVTSTGTVVSAVRVVQQTFEILFQRVGFSPAFTNVLASGGTIRLTSTNGVDGSISMNDPEVPLLTNTVYDALLAQTAIPWITNAPSFPLNLNNQTNYYKLPGTLNISGSITGPGAIVVSGNGGVNINGNIGGDIQLISGGKISIDLTGCLGSNDVLYSAINTGIGIDVTKDIVLNAGTCALVTPGSINIQKSLTFTGLIYAGDVVQADKASTITGCVITGTNIWFKKDLSATYDPDQFTNSIPLQLLFGNEQEQYGPGSVNSIIWLEKRN